MTSNVPSKTEQFQAFLDRGSVFVHIDPRRPGVVVPESLAVRSRVVLQVRRALALPLPDIQTDDVGVHVTLSFARTPFRCTLPWSAIFSLVAEDGEVTVWPTDLPTEMAPARGPMAVESVYPRRSEHPGRPVSCPPPAMGRARRSQAPSRIPAARPDSVIPGSFQAAMSIPRTPAVSPALAEALADLDAAPAPAPRRCDSTPAASRAMRANDSMSLLPQAIWPDR